MPIYSRANRLRFASGLSRHGVSRFGGGFRFVPPVALLVTLIGVAVTIYVQRDNIWPEQKTPGTPPPTESKATTTPPPAEPLIGCRVSARSDYTCCLHKPPHRHCLSVVTPATTTNCPPDVSDAEPRVTLRIGDLVVAGGGGLYCLDGATFKETLIVSGDYLTNVRALPFSVMVRFS